MEIGVKARTHIPAGLPAGMRRVTSDDYGSLAAPLRDYSEGP